MQLHHSPAAALVPAAALQSAVDAGAISARAKPAAAAEKARDLQAALKARGCMEEFTPDPELMAEGQVRQFALLDQTSCVNTQWSISISARIELHMAAWRSSRQTLNSWLRGRCGAIWGSPAFACSKLSVAWSNARMHTGWHVEARALADGDSEPNVRSHGQGLSAVM
jgi:hypothetical protein